MLLLLRRATSQADKRVKVKVLLALSPADAEDSHFLTHGFDFWDVVDYADLVQRRGRIHADVCFPEIARVLNEGCEFCEAQIAELLEWPVSRE